MKKRICATVLALACCGAMAQSNDTLAKITSSGVASLGVRESSGALSYGLGGGQYGGYHVELCKLIVARLEKLSGKKIATKYIQVTSQTRIPLVQSGVVDMECGSTTNTLARQKDVAFALTTYMEEVRIAVRVGSGISSIANLDGKVVATTAGTTSVQLIRKHARDSGLHFTEILGRDHADSFLLIETRRADAFIMDSQILAFNIATRGTPADFQIVGKPLSIEPIALMFRKDDPGMKRFVDDSIREIAKNGGLAKLYDKWFLESIPPGGIKLGLQASSATKAIWANPNDRAMEDYLK